VDTIRRKSLIFVGLLVAWLQIASGEAVRPGPKAVPGLPEDVNLGMGVDDLLKARPQAKPFDTGVSLDGKQPPNRAEMLKGSHLLFEPAERNDGLHSGVGYFVKDGRCTQISKADEYAHADLVIKRTELLQKMVSVLGSGYERHLRRKGFKGVTYLAPVFLWKEKERSVALSVSSDYPGVFFEWGTLTVDLWTHGEAPGPDMEADVDQLLMATLFAPLEKGLKKQAK
jgi:hypothetical protein